MFSACGTGNTGALQLGRWPTAPTRFRVRAKDGADYDHVPAARTWTVDRTPPVATLDPFSGPGQGALQAVDAETFAFSLNEAGGTECSVDGAAFAACTSPLALSGLAPGAHSFSVRGTDAAGNVGAAVTRRWSVAAARWRRRRRRHPRGLRRRQPGGPPRRGRDRRQRRRRELRRARRAGHGRGGQGDVTFKLTATGKGTKLKTLRATGVPKGATVTVTCKGKGCPKKSYVKRGAPSTVRPGGVPAAADDGDAHRDRHPRERQGGPRPEDPNRQGPEDHLARPVMVCSRESSALPFELQAVENRLAGLEPATSPL